jgi:hypothetical protein
MKYCNFTFIICMLFCTHASAEADKPNIVLFLVDDMGLMDTSVPMLTDEDGKPQRHPLNDWYRTPSMARLAAMGTRFSNFYSHSVCSPTRVSIMTGQNAARHRTTDYIFPWKNNRLIDTKAYPLAVCQQVPPEWNWAGLKQRDVCLPRQLRQVGYTTIHVGKGHFAPFDHEGAEPLNLGFDVNVAGSSIGAPGSYYGQAGYGRAAKGPHARPVPGLDKYHGTDTFLTEALTLEAKAEVDKAVAAQKPFFLYMSHYAVHSPFNSDPRFAANYRDRGKNYSSSLAHWIESLSGIRAERRLGSALPRQPVPALRSPHSSSLRDHRVRGRQSHVANSLPPVFIALTVPKSKFSSAITGGRLNGDHRLDVLLLSSNHVIQIVKLVEGFHVNLKTAVSTACRSGTRRRKASGGDRPNGTNPVRTRSCVRRTGIWGQCGQTVPHPRPLLQHPSWRRR